MHAAGAIDRPVMSSAVGWFLFSRRGRTHGEIGDIMPAVACQVCKIRADTGVTAGRHRQTIPWSTKRQSAALRVFHRKLSYACWRRLVTISRSRRATPTSFNRQASAHRSDSVTLTRFSIASWRTSSRWRPSMRGYPDDDLLSIGLEQGMSISSHKALGRWTMLSNERAASSS